MPRYNVITPNNKLLVFSTIVDDFITDEMTEEEWVDWCCYEYGERNRDIRRDMLKNGKGNWMCYECALELIKMREEFECRNYEEH